MNILLTNIKKDLLIFNSKITQKCFPISSSNISLYSPCSLPKFLIFSWNIHEKISCGNIKQQGALEKEILMGCGNEEINDRMAGLGPVFSGFGIEESQELK